MKLIGEAQDDPKARIPLFVNLTKLQDKAVMPRPRRQRQPWDGSTAEKSNSKSWFDEWLVQIVTEQYALPARDREVVRYWVARSGVSLLLDGFDEVNESQRRDFAQILNEAFIDRFYDGPVVVCSRIREYEILIRQEIDAPSNDKVIFRLRGGVVLQPLEKEQIKKYLAEAQASGLSAAIRQDDALYELARTPLTLSMMTLAYGDLSRDAIPTGLSLAEGRRHLFDAYVDYMMQRQAHRDLGIPFTPGVRRHLPTRYSRAHVDRYLGWLAVQLSMRWRTEFHPHQLFTLLKEKPRAQHIAWPGREFVRTKRLFYGICYSIALLFLLGFLPLTTSLGEGIALVFLVTLYLLSPSFLLLHWIADPIFGDADLSRPAHSTKKAPLVNEPVKERFDEAIKHRILVLKYNSQLGISRHVLTPLLHFVVGISGSFPFEYKQFFSYGTDTFVLKVAGTTELEFMHGLLRDHFATRELSPLLSSRDSEVRARTVEQLSLQGEAAIDILLDLLRGGDPELRRLAVSGICRIPSPEVFPALRQALSDPDVLVRRAVVANASYLAKQESILLWHFALGDVDVFVRLMAYARIAESKSLYDNIWDRWRVDHLSDIVTGLLDPGSDRVSALLDALRVSDSSTQTLVVFDTLKARHKAEKRS